MTGQDLYLQGSLLLLSVSSLLGFVQYRVRHDPQRFARWRVVHAGGATGAVQLLALLAAHHFFGGGQLSAISLALVFFSTWAFFLGPLAKACEKEVWARRINMGGSVLAVPGYLALPFAFSF